MTTIQVQIRVVAKFTLGNIPMQFKDLVAEAIYDVKTYGDPYYFGWVYNLPPEMVLVEVVEVDLPKPVDDLGEVDYILHLVRENVPCTYPKLVDGGKKLVAVRFYKS